MGVGCYLFRSQGGTAADDVAKSVALGVDNSIVLGGYTAGNWDGPNAGLNDFAAVKLDANGTELWRWQVR